jgi:two-component system, chemotaxis family, protein-glutamate methylesterase/glutaminase
MPVLHSTSANTQGGPYRVMVVDDSAVIRGVYGKTFEGEKDVSIVATAGNGETALQILARQDVDVVILDIEMPVMDGLTALPKILGLDNSVQVLIASTLSKRNAEISLSCLQLGAKDYLTKPSSSGEMSTAVDFKRDLVAKTKALAARRRKLKNWPQPDGLATKTKLFAAEKTQAEAHKPAGGLLSSAPPPATKEIVLRKLGPHRPEILAVGSSTGGPNALFAFFKGLDPHLNMPIVLTQHMPPNFTAILAEHITKQTPFPAKEAQNGDVLENNKVLVAPGDYHLTVIEEGGRKVIRLNQDAPENFCRPAVDPMLRSLVPIYGGKVLMVMLTGMGSDGLLGCRKLVDAGATIVAQDEASSVVWGMPGAVAMAGLCHAVLPLDDIAPKLSQIMKGQR